MMEKFEEKKEHETTVILRPNGPVVISGEFTLKDEDGNELEKRKIISICRCGHSKNKPYCDGSHKAAH